MKDPSSMLADLADRFEVRRFLGAGSFGDVYSVFDRQHQKLVAIKRLHRVDPNALYRFKKEFRSLADLTHPNLVNLFELFSRNEQWFFTMEMIEGEHFVQSLRSSGVVHNTQPTLTEKTLVRKRESATLVSKGNLSTDLGTFADDQGSTLLDSFSLPDVPEFGLAPESLFSDLPEPEPLPVDFSRLRKLLVQLAQGIHKIHGHGKLHRDLKPSNVLVTAEDRVVVLDFGLVTERAERESRASLDFAGTPAYMAPEQIRKRASEASDWYSVGVILFEALTARLPFEGDTMAILSRKLIEPPPDPRSYVPDIPPDLASLCEELLRIDPAARPNGVEVLRRLGVEQSPEDNQSQLRLPLTGRDEPLRRLTALFESLEGGKYALVHVRGVSGMGKTELVRQFFLDVRARAPRTLLLRGRCYEHESVPFKAFDGVIDELTRYLKRLPTADVEPLLPEDISSLARIFPVLSRVPAVSARNLDFMEKSTDLYELRSRAFSALRQLFTNISAERPLVIFIDDLQWGDVDSSPLLTEVLTPPDAPSLLLVTCARSEELDSKMLKEMEQIDATLAAFGVPSETIELGPLSDESSRELSRLILGDDTEEKTISAVVSEAGGSPFFIRELAQHALGLKDTGDTLNLGLSYDDLIRSRSKGLDDSHRLLLEMVSVAGHPLDYSTACAAIGIAMDELPVLQMQSANLLRTRKSRGGLQLSPNHDRIREAVCRVVPSDEKKRHHLKLAEALERTKINDAEHLAYHYILANVPEKAAEHLARAAEQAFDSLAFERAAEFYQLILDEELCTEEEIPACRVRLANSLAISGRGPEAADVFCLLADESSELEALRFRMRAADQYMGNGHIEKGFETVRSVLKILGIPYFRKPLLLYMSLMYRRFRLWMRGLKFQERKEAEVSPDQLLMVDTCWSLTSALGIVDILWASNIQALHLLEALRSGEPRRLCKALIMDTVYLASPNDRKRKQVHRIMKQTKDIVDRFDDDYLRAVYLMGEGFHAYIDSNWIKAVEKFEASEQLFLTQQIRTHLMLTQTRGHSCTALLLMGRWNRYRKLVPAYLQDAKNRGDLYAEIQWTTGLAFVRDLAGGNPDKAERDMLAVFSRWSSKNFLVQHFWLVWLRFEVALYKGEFEQALEHLNAVETNIRESMILRVRFFRVNYQHFWAKISLAMCSKLFKERGVLDRQILTHLNRGEEKIRELRKENIPWSIALSGLMDAGRELIFGEKSKAISMLESNEKEFIKIGMEMNAMVNRRSRGVLLDSQEGLLLKGEADNWLTQHGVAEPDRMSRTMFCFLN